MCKFKLRASLCPLIHHVKKIEPHKVSQNLSNLIGFQKDQKAEPQFHGMGLRMGRKK